MDDTVKITTERVGNGLVVRASGRIEGMDKAEMFRKNMEDQVREDDRHLVIDMSEVTYMSSAGLRAIAVLMNHARKHAIAMAVCGLTDRIRTLFVVSGFDRMIPSFEDREQALAHCAEQ